MMDKEIERLLNEPIDLRKLLDALDIAEETLRADSFFQPKLFERASRFYVVCMKRRIEAETVLEERMADRGLYFRRKLSSRAEKRGKSLTEKQINERVILLDSVKALRVKYHDALTLETYAKSLCDAFKQRKDMIRSLSGGYDEESRAEFREFRKRKVQEAWDSTKDKLNKKYPGKRI